MLFLSISGKFHRGTELCTKCLKLLEGVNRKWGIGIIYSCTGTLLHHKKEDNMKDKKIFSLTLNKAIVKSTFPFHIIYFLYEHLTVWINVLTSLWQKAHSYLSNHEENMLITLSFWMVVERHREAINSHCLGERQTYKFVPASLCLRVSQQGSLYKNELYCRELHLSIVPYRKKVLPWA